MNRRVMVSSGLLAILLPLAARRRRPPDCRGIAAPRARRLPALRRLARSHQRQQQGIEEALGIRPPGLLRQQQGDYPLHRTRRGEGRGAAGGEPSGSVVGPMDVDARHRPRPPHRAAGSLHAILRHGLQLRRSGGARRQPVRFQLAGRGAHRRRAHAGASNRNPSRARARNTPRRACGFARTTTFPCSMRTT